MMGDLTMVGDLLEFSFESTVAPGLPEAALLRLARCAAAFNARMGLTGRLRREGDRFVQVLEGRAAVLLPLAGRILADPRHEAIRVIAFGTVARRRFADWSAEGFDGESPSDACGSVRLMPADHGRRRAISASVLSLGSAGRLSARSDA